MFSRIGFKYLETSLGLFDVVFFKFNTEIVPFKTE